MTMTSEETLEQNVNDWKLQRQERIRVLNDAALSLTQQQREIVTEMYKLLEDVDRYIREAFDIDMCHARRISNLEWKMREAFPELCKGECCCDN